MIATITAIAEKKVQRSQRSYGNHSSSYGNRALRLISFQLKREFNNSITPEENTVLVFAPQGFPPEGEIPRRHSNNSRVYYGKYLQLKYTVGMPEKIG